MRKLQKVAKHNRNNRYNIKQDYFEASDIDDSNYSDEDYYNELCDIDTEDDPCRTDMSYEDQMIQMENDRIDSNNYTKWRDYIRTKNAEEQNFEADYAEQAQFDADMYDKNITLNGKPLDVKTYYTLFKLKHPNNNYDYDDEYDKYYDVQKKLEEDDYYDNTKYKSEKQRNQFLKHFCGTKSKMDHLRQKQPKFRVKHMSKINKLNLFRKANKLTQIGQQIADEIYRSDSSMDIDFGKVDGNQLVFYVAININDPIEVNYNIEKIIIDEILPVAKRFANIVDFHYDGQIEDDNYDDDEIEEETYDNDNDEYVWRGDVYLTV